MGELPTTDRFYVRIPNCTMHKNHPNIGFGVLKHVNQKISEEIGNIVTRGITQTFQIQGLLEEFVIRMFPDESTRPNPADRSWYPTEQDIKNHVYMTSLKRRFSEIDQTNLEHYVSAWKIRKEIFTTDCAHVGNV